MKVSVILVTHVSRRLINVLRRKKKIDAEGAFPGNEDRTKQLNNFEH